jgi:hypothetical protein
MLPSFLSPRKLYFPGLGSDPDFKIKGQRNYLELHILE